MKRGTLFDYAFKKSTSDQPPLEKKRRLTESHCDEEKAEEEKEDEWDCVDDSDEDDHHHDHDGIDVDDAKAKKKTQQKLKFRDAWKITWPWLLEVPVVHKHGRR